MPFPLIILALGALVSGAVVSKGAEMYGDNAIKEAEAELKSTELYVEEKRAVFANTRKSYLERIVSYTTMINAIAGDAMPSQSQDFDRIPDEIRAAWDLVADQVRSMSRLGAPRPSAWTTRDRDIQRTLLGASRVFPNLGPVIAFASMAYAVHGGVSHALKGAEFREKALAQATEARNGADSQVRTIQAAFEEMGAKFDLLIVPWLRTALGPPRDEGALVFLRMASSELAEEARRLMRDFADE
ncbi:hypothetical protein AS593_09405 [Caulobacter vibrioides]|nr:hypothetical protein AS593_09405 [Caulobacter vibrioides]